MRKRSSTGGPIKRRMIWCARKSSRRQPITKSKIRSSPNTVNSCFSPETVVLQIVQCGKCEHQDASRECYSTGASEMLCPIRASQEKQDRRHQRHDGKLKDMGRRCLHRLGAAAGNR